MKKLVLCALVSLSAASAFAQSGGVEVIVSDGKVQFSVRGAGGWVCSAEDSFKKIPVLGRGETRSEAEMNAKFGASMRAGRNGDMFFSNVTSCERSESGNGSISMTSDNAGTTISVQGPSHYQCISVGTFRRIPFIAKAGTKTEASALSGSACAADAGDSGFFCDTSCEKISSGGGTIGTGGVQIRLPGGIRLPRINR